MDVRLYHPDKDLWDWCNSGNHASYFAAQSLSAKKNFETISFHPALKYYFKAGGASVEFDAMPGEMTFGRLGLWDEKPFMVIIAGEAAKLPAATRKKLNDQTSPTWPHVHARLDCDFEEFLTTFPCNHVLGLVGDHVQALVYLCEIAGITPVVLGKRGRERMAPIWERV
jgi:L-fucose/D-arabinose isomerase